MGRYVLAAAFVLFLSICSSGAGESASVDERTVLMNQTLSNLGDVSGLHGGNAQEMQQFLGMVQTPEMVQLVDRLSAQFALQVGANPDNADLAKVDEFVRNSITLEDVQKLLGQTVASEDFQKALSREVSAEEMQNMLQMLQQGSSAR